MNYCYGVKKKFTDIYGFLIDKSKHVNYNWRKADLNLQPIADESTAHPFTNFAKHVLHVRYQ